jgi:hypothetical protein
MSTPASPATAQASHGTQPPGAATAPTSQTYQDATPPSPGPGNGTVSAREYGLYAVIAGLVVLAALDAAALAAFHSNINTAVGVIAAISSPIVAMVSAYFGIKVGAQSGSAHTALSEQARKRSETEAMAFLGQLTPEQAKPVLKKLGIPVPDDQTAL